ncbi:MAG TPA: hypothetical protein VGO00_19085 [Kofleriaceae bacterium]|jgi:hypothetical protein|nr:hypothetical protein [Kofleriaceae bacterium]
MRFALGMFVVLCSTAVAAPSPRRTVPFTRQLKTKDKVTSASYHHRKTPMPLRSGF